ncbi:MAG: hypothetical protein ACYC56_09280 [Candidatus Aquicultor sp.]
MQRVAVKLVIIVAALSLLTPSYVYARLLLCSPADMITKSQLIVIAKVEKRSQQEGRVIGEFAIKKVLIGNFGEKTIKIKSSDWFDGTPGIPGVGTEVFMLLSKDYEGKYSCWNPNSMGIIKNGRVVSIYQGVNVDRQPYTCVYNCFIEGMERIESESARKQDLTKNPNSSKLIYTEVLIPAALLILFLYLRRNDSDTDQ